MAKRLISLFLSASVVLLSPGLGVYEALAQVVTQGATPAAGAPLALPASFPGAPLSPGSLTGSQGLSPLRLGGALPGTVAVTPKVSLQLSPAAGLSAGLSSRLAPAPSPAAPAAAPLAARADAVRPVAPAAARPAGHAPTTAAAAASPGARAVLPAREVSAKGRTAGAASRAAVDAARQEDRPRAFQAPSLDKASKEVAEVLSALRDVPAGSAERSAAAGEGLERALTGEQSGSRGSAEPVPASRIEDLPSPGRIGLAEPGGYSAQPAGKESIETAARTYDGPPVQAPKASFAARMGLAGSPSLRERLRGFWDRKLAASRWHALWIAPLWIPFLLADSARWTLSSQGRRTIGRVGAFSLLTLGAGTLLAVPYFVPAATLAEAALSVSRTKAFWLGVAGTLGGWGLVRYTGPKGPAEEPWYETLGVALAALATFAGVGTAFLGIGGVAAYLLPAGAYLASPLLLRRLPRWLGQGLLAAARGVRYGVARARENLAAVHTRTRFAQNQWAYARRELGRARAKSFAPAVLSLAASGLRLLQEAAALALGLAWGLAQAPADFLWGALHEAHPASGWARFAGAFSAGVARRTIGMQGPAGRWLASQLPALDDVSAGTQAPTAKAKWAYLKATLAQLAWLLSLAAWTPVALLWSLVDAAGAVLHPGTAGTEGPSDVLK